MTKPRIGFIGLGLMGQGFTAHLVESGYAVTGFDIDPAKVAKAAEHGVTAAASSAEVTANSDVILVCVISTDAVQQAVLGEGGVVESGTADKVLVDAPKQEVALYVRGRVLLAQRRPQEALVPLQQAAELELAVRAGDIQAVRVAFRVLLLLQDGDGRRGDQEASALFPREARRAA